MDQSKLKVKVVSSELRSVIKKLTAKFSDQKSKKSQLKMTRLLYVSDAMEPKSTKKDYLAEDAMDLVPSTLNSSMT